VRVKGVQCRSAHPIAGDRVAQKPGDLSRELLLIANLDGRPALLASAKFSM
jgi:hypothetical protein